MRPGKFEYSRAQNLRQAVQELAADPEAKALAGGHSLIPALNLRLAQPSRLVDIGRLDELKKIEFAEGRLTVGALCTHAQIAASEQVRSHAPALAAAAAVVGDPQVRSFGTLGGNLAHADPASDPPTAVLAQDGELVLEGPQGGRRVAAADFFQDLFTTDLEEGELITAVHLPSAESQRAAYLKLAHPASRYAVVGVAAILQMDGSRCVSARVAVGGAVPTVRRAAGAESVLAGSDLSDGVLEEAAVRLTAELGDDLIGDGFASAEYRRAMCGVYLKRVIRRALE